MATINIGSIKFKWQGAYAGGTAYTVDDVVSYNGSSYICILASTGNLPTNTTYWEQMSSAGTNGTDGTDLGTTLTTQGDIVYRDASGIARLGAGTSGQALVTQGTGANPIWSNVGGNMTPAFSVNLSGNQNVSDSVTTKIQFDTEILDSDGAFNTTNYEFTVPSGKAGKYFIHMHGYYYGSGNAAMFALALDVKHTPSGGSQTNLIPLKYYEQSGNLEVARSGSFSGIVDLGVGDVIAGYTSVSTNGLAPSLNQSGTHFSGYKIIE